MADENKARSIFGNQNKDSEPKVENAEANATATTSPVEEGEVTAAVSDEEAAALDGAAGPNRTPAFVKRDFEDENVQLTDTDDLASAKAGAAASSGSTLDFNGLFAARAAGDEVPEGREDEVQYTSTPIANLRIGRYQFTDGVLRLKSDDAEKFEEILKKSALRTQQVVRKIDRRAGEVIARRFLEQTQGKRNRDVDTSDNAPSAPRPAES